MIEQPKNLPDEAQLPLDENAFPGLEGAGEQLPPPRLVMPPEPVVARAGVPWMAIALIAAALAGLGAVGYLAWQRGLLGGTASEEPLVKVVEVNDQSVSGDGTAVEGDPLDKLDDKIVGLKHYRPYADALRKMDAELEATTIEVSEAGKLAESTKQRLYELQPLGLAFTSDYEEFERRAARDSGPKLQSYQEIVRTAFIARMQRFVEKIGEAYASEQGINNPVFTMSDTFIAAVDKYGRADAGPLREKWLAAVHAQEQSGLVDTYAPQIAEMQKRIEALKSLHREVDGLLKAAPEYHIRGGIIGSTARELLDVYDSLASRVEGMVVDFEQYVVDLPAEHNTDRINALVKEFNRLAQEDHFYAFSETYKIYQQDKELEHPAYVRLKEHFNFVEAHWPTAAGNYRQTYTAAETLWAKQWASQ
ncbi:MAG: hypothetical protein M3R04_02590 [bacterium]|nr:hypothetical protein [bacterium]